jgi:hypothetical protein
MQNKLKLSALAGHVVIDGDTVSVMNDDEVVIQLSMEEWEILREDFRLDDIVDYERGETPMTGFQFRMCVGLFREIKTLKQKKPV